MKITLAQHKDAKEIARMSRDLIEYDLRWRYRPARISNLIARPSTNVSVCKSGPELIGFGIMTYYEDDANLDLLAVKPDHQRQGIANSIIDWLSTVAVTAGIQRLHVQVRESNKAGLAFYQKRQFKPVAIKTGMYDGKEDAIKLSRTIGHASFLSN